jgi:hypothetical protein
MAGQPPHSVAEAFLGEVGEGVLLGVAQHALDGAVDEDVEGADQLVDRHAARLGVRHGDLLDGVLHLAVGGFQLADQVGTMQQFEGGGPMAVQPFFQHLADPLAGVQGVEVLGLDAERLEPLLDLGLLGLGGAEGQDGDRAELAGVLVEGFLVDPGRGDLAAVHLLVGGGDGLGAVFGGEFEAPARARRAPDEDLEVHPRTRHRARVRLFV